jgi:hypothetical protein
VQKGKSLKEKGVVNKLTPADDSFTHFAFCPLVAHSLIAVVIISIVISSPVVACLQATHCTIRASLLALL